MQRKIWGVLFAVGWGAFAYLIWPAGISDREVSSITLVDLLRLVSICSVALGIVLTIWTWRS